MDNTHLRKLLRDVSEGSTTPEEAEKILQTLPFEDLDFVNIDNHRSLRTGYRKWFSARARQLSKSE